MSDSNFERVGVFHAYCYADFLKSATGHRLVPLRSTDMRWVAPSHRFRQSLESWSGALSNFHSRLHRGVTPNEIQLYSFCPMHGLVKTTEWGIFVRLYAHSEIPIFSYQYITDNISYITESTSYKASLGLLNHTIQKQIY